MRAEDVVAHARASSSPFHGTVYALNDKDAAYEHRLNIARNIINHLEAQITFPDGTRSEFTKAFFSLTKSAGQGIEIDTGFLNTVTVAADPVRRQQVLATALKEAKMFMDKYRFLEKELAVIFRAIKKMLKDSGDDAAGAPVKK